LFGKRKTHEQITCTVCGHEQKVPVSAVSTNCTKCGQHFYLKNGQIQEEKKTESKLKVRYDSEWKPKEEEKIDLWENVESVGTGNISEKEFDDGIELNKPTSIYKPQRKRPQVKKYYSDSGKTRKVSCFRCEHTHDSPVQATSANCPRCGLYISLQDHVINSSRNETIETRGNVKIESSGSMSGVTLKCHDLQIKGKFTGGVDCTGILELYSNATFHGRLRCQKLILHKGASLSSKTDVQVDEGIECEGALDATNRHVDAGGPVIVSKEASLIGDLSMQCLSVEQGGVYQGAVVTVEVGEAE